MFTHVIFILKNFLFQKPVNDEEPVLVVEPFEVEANKKTQLTNSSFLIVDFDTKPENLTIFVEKFPKHGKKKIRLKL